MTVKKENIDIKNLDHLGIVAGIIDDLGIGFFRTYCAKVLG